MDNERLTWRILEYDRELAMKGSNTWSKDIKGILHECELDQYFHLNSEPVNLATVECILRNNFAHQWKRDMKSMSKLTLYDTIKEICQTEDYLSANYLTHSQKAALASARAGTLPIEIERGRWRGVSSGNRLCKQCESGQVENLNHFMLQCENNLVERNTLFQNIQEKTTLNLVITTANTDIIVGTLLTDSRTYKCVANYIIMCLKKTRK
jgi:hypothetical protein